MRFIFFSTQGLKKNNEITLEMYIIVQMSIKVERF